MYIKLFDKWNKVKQHVDSEERRFVVRPGEIRWCIIGVNIGEEIDGKGDSFTRPVLVVDVVNTQTAMVIPMTTKLKNFAGYKPFVFKGVEMRLCLNHARSISQRRLLKRKGRISQRRLQKVKEQLKEFYRL